MRVGEKIYTKEGLMTEVTVFTVAEINDWGETGSEVIGISLPWEKGKLFNFSTTGDNRFRQFSDYFYTEKEYRKLKLEKIKKSQ